MPPDTEKTSNNHASIDCEEIMNCDRERVTEVPQPPPGDSGKSPGPQIACGIGFLVFVYFSVYSWAYFARSQVFEAEVSTNTLKLLIPAMILVSCVTLRPQFIRRGKLYWYCVFGIILSAWLFVPSALNTNPLNAGKFALIFVTLTCAGMLIIQTPGIFRVYARCLVISLCLSFVVYICAYILFIRSGFDDEIFTGYEGFVRMSAQNNVTADLGFIRFSGFFLEPSNASGYCFCGFFLSRFLFITDQNNFWRATSWACLLFGILALSIVGYLAILLAVLIGPSSQKQWKRFTMTCVLVLAVMSVLLARFVVPKYFLGSSFLRIIFGIREITPTSVDAVFEGRLSSLQHSFFVGFDSVVGFGIPSLVGENGEYISPSAIGFWVHCAGLIGLALILLRESCVLVRIHYSRQGPSLGSLLVQAWLVLAIQNLSYGTFWEPGYLIIAIAAVAPCSFVNRRAALAGLHTKKCSPGALMA